MSIRNSIQKAAIAILAITALASTGCQHWRLQKELYRSPEPVRGLGDINDHIFQMQEENAAASEFVVYDHEFNLHTAVLNTAGRDHVKQIAARSISGQPFQVLVERSMNTKDRNTEFEYPVHPNPELDMRRREVIVYALNAMGVKDADNLVVVSPAPNEGLDGQEAAQGYNRAFNGFGLGGFGGGFGGFGGGFGGFGGGFGGGGFGGGGFF